MDDQLDELKQSVESLNKRLDTMTRQYEERMTEESMRCVSQAISARASSCSLPLWHRHDELARIVQRVVEIGLRGGWAEFEGTPVPLPHIDLTKKPPTPPSYPLDSSSGSQDTPSRRPEPPSTAE